MQIPDNDIRIDPKSMSPLKCEECGSEHFREIYLIRKQSGLMVGSSNDIIIPVPTFKCDSCGHINKEFTPKF